MAVSPQVAQKTMLHLGVAAQGSKFVSSQEALYVWLRSYVHSACNYLVAYYTFIHTTCDFGCRFCGLMLMELILPHRRVKQCSAACQFLWVSIHCILQLFGGTCLLQEHTRGLVHVGRVCVVVVVCGTGGC